MIKVVLGALEEQEADGVVRAVRTDLAPVTTGSRDLVAVAGTELEERLERMGPLPIGGAVLTPAGRLVAGYLIHVVVMSEEEPQTSESIRRALRNGLRRASDWGLESLALPPLGIGAGSIEPETSARQLLDILLEHLEGVEGPRDLRIVVGSDYEAELFTRLLNAMSKHRSSAHN